jgi:hemolysin III
MNMSRLFLQAQDPVSCETHAIGAAASFAGGVLFLFRALRAGAPTLALAAAMCFSLSLMALYSASAVYHFYPGTAESGGVKRVLRKMDHSMIYVLIAGSYTPFSMVLLPQPKGLRFCLALWTVALAGVTLKLVWLNAPRIVSTLFYLAMGWAILFVWQDFLTIGQPCLTLVALGGICYSVGAVFYAVKKPNISTEWTFHELFHLLILAGSLFHYLAVYFYVL